MKFLVFTFLGLLVLVNSSPDSTSVDEKSNDEPKIVQFNIQCLDVESNGDDDQVGSPAEESPILSKLSNIKEKLNSDKKQKLRSIAQPKESEIIAESDQPSATSTLPKLKDRLETLKKDGSDLRNLLLSKTQDMVGSSSADQPEVKSSLLPQLKEKLDNLKEKITSQDSIGKLPNTEARLDKIKEKLGKLKDKTERSDIVGAAQNNPSSLALPAPETTLNRLKEKLNEIKNKAQKPGDTVGAAQNEPSPSILLPPSSAMNKVNEKLNELKNKARKPSDIVSAVQEDLKGKVNDLKEKVKNREIVGAAQSDSLSLALPSSGLSRDKVREKINDLKEKIQKPSDIKGKMNDLKEKLKRKDIVGAAQEESVSITSPSDTVVEKPNEINSGSQINSSPINSLKDKVNNLKKKFKNMELVGAAQGDSPSIVLPPSVQEKLEELKEKLQNPPDIVKSSQSLDNLNQKLNDLKEKARNMDNLAVDKMREKLNKLKSKNIDMVGAAQNNSPSKTVSPLSVNMEELKEKLNELKQRSAIGENSSLNKIKEKINNLKQRNNQDIVSAAQNISPLSTLPSPDETLAKLKNKFNNMKEKSKLQDTLRTAQSNLLPKKLSPPTSPLDKLKDQLADIKQRSNANQPSNVINKLREQVNDLRQKTRRSDLVGAAQNEAPVINLLDPLNILNRAAEPQRRISGRQNIRPTNPALRPDNRIEDTVREITRRIPPIQLPTFEARLIPAPINLASFEPIVANDRLIQTITTLTTPAPDLDNDGSASEPENRVAVSPVEENGDELLLEPDEDQTANDSIVKPVTAPSKLSETKNKLNKLAETIKSRTAELVKPTVKPSLNKITSAIDNMKKKLEQRKTDMVGSATRAVGRTAKKEENEVSYAGITQKEVEKKSCDICSCLMKYLGKNEESRAVPEKPAAKSPFSLKRPKQLFRLGDQNVLEDRIQPSFARPPSNFKINNLLKGNNIVGNGIPNSLIPGDDDKENIKKLVEFANLVEELDDYLSKKTKTVIARLSKFIDAGMDTE